MHNIAVSFYFSDTFKKLTVNELPKFKELVDKHDYDVVFFYSITTLLTVGKTSAASSVSSKRLI